MKVGGVIERVIAELLLVYVGDRLGNLGEIALFLRFLHPLGVEHLVIEYFLPESLSLYLLRCADLISNLEILEGVVLRDVPKVLDLLVTELEILYEVLHVFLVVLQDYVLVLLIL